MANPYETTSNFDPFREPSPPQGSASLPPPGAASNYGSQAPAREDFGGASPFYGVAPAAAPPMKFYDGPSMPSSAPAATPPAPTAASPAEGEAPKPTSKFWTIAFYQQFFDINTRQVLLRLSNTLVPLNPPDFLMDRNWHLNQEMGEEGAAAEEAALEEAGVVLCRKPDLYGPFWICTTLWITLAIVSNIMSSIAFARDEVNDGKKWKYDFKVASVAYVVIYCYCFVFGAAVWGVMQWKHLPATLADTVCLYGYSLFIFELVAILCMIPVSALQWVVVMVGGVWSTAYLLINMWHMWKTTLERVWFFGLVGFVTIFHMGLTMSFKFYFLNYKL